MGSNFIDDILKVCKVLNDNNVDYMIVGGTALAFHGYYRITIEANNLPSNKHDFDFWYNPTYENYFNLLNALEKLGINVMSFKEEQAPNPRKSFFTQEFEQFKIDFLPEILGLNRFRDSFAERQISVYKGVEISIISKKDLIKSKEFVGRKKDFDDLRALRLLFPDDE